MTKFPCFIMLRKLAKEEHSVRDAIIAAFEYHHFPGADKFVDSALAQGKMLIVLDGLDEVGASRAFVAEAIRSFCEQDEQHSQPNRVIVTCRENSYRTEDLRTVIQNVVRVEPFANHHMRIFLAGWPTHKGRVALRLFGQLQQDAQIRDICRNPLLLTILTGLYLDADRFEIPSSRNEFYTKAIDELLIQRPARKGVPQSFSAEEKRQILERVSLERLETVEQGEDSEEFEEDAILRHATDILRREFDGRELIKELVETNSIIRPTGTRSYTLTHRTIQEYLAAREAMRIRELQDVIARFLERTDLIEVLYFVCGLIRNIPRLRQVIDSLSSVGYWEHAGRCMLSMTETPPEDLVETVATGLYHEIEASKDYQNQVEILSSLAQRRASEFDPARRRFTEVIERITQSEGEQDVAALGSALAATPEIAMRVIPGLLQQNAPPRWQRAAVRLLRDIGTEEALDQLVQLLDAPAGPKRSEAAKVLVGLIKTRNADLRSRAFMLPERSDPEVWPLDAHFPERLAVPMAEGIFEELPDDEVAPNTGNAAIDAAVRVLQGRANPPGDARFVQKWCKVPRDAKLLRAREFSGRLMIRLGWGVVAAWFLIVGGLLSWGYLDSKFIVLQLSPMDVLAVDDAPLQNLQDAAKAIVDDIGEQYPPNASGFARIWPWNWKIEPVIPIESDAAYGKLRRLTRSDWDPYEMIKNPGPFLERLPSETDHSMIITLELAFLDLKESLPNVDSRISVPTRGFLSLLAMGMMFLLILFFIFIRPRRSGFLSEEFIDLTLRLSMEEVYVFFFLFACGTYPFLSTNSESFERYIPFVIAVAFVLIGFTLSTIQWPRNPLMKTIKDLEPPDQEEEEEEIKERKKKKKDSES